MFTNTLKIKIPSVNACYCLMRTRSLAGQVSVIPRDERIL